MNIFTLCNFFNFKTRELPQKTKKVFVCVIMATIFMILFFHEGQICSKKECPFHHIKSNMLKPFYMFSCPKTFPSNSGFYSTCSTLPLIIMISARPIEQRLKAANSWKNQDLIFFNTTTLEQSVFKCSPVTFSNKLFNIYLYVFASILEKYPNQEDFIIVEDDAELVSEDKMRIESCLARQYQYTFYSFFRTKFQEDSCMYQHGTVAFYVKRQFINTLLNNVDATTVCFIPIDMYISMRGPWYATKNNIIKHNSRRFQL